MTKAPRASLCITILDDEDYRVLMAHNCGLEAFGVFVAILLCGRERLQQGKARQLSETESLTFDNSTTHILALTHISQRQLDRCMRTLFEVAKDTGSKPWMYLDESSHLVIRSFFKFNTASGWGGSRPGAGKKSRANQDDSRSFQDETVLESSCGVSGTGTGTGITPLPPQGERAGVLIEDQDAEPFDGGGYEPAPAPPPAARNQPATVERVAANAESLFPCLDFGAKVRQLQRSYDLDVLEAAMIDAHGAGKTSWRYVEGIYRNRMADGRGAAVVRLAAQTRARPDPVRPKFGVAELDKQIADHEARVLAGLRANAR